jgi:hypothetical protein
MTVAAGDRYIETMRSPFPGMDPYIEEFWNDFHHPFLSYLRDDLNDLLPPHYRASIAARVVMDDFEDDIKLLSREPDISVFDWPARGTDSGAGVAAHSRHYLLQTPKVIQFEPQATTTEYSIEITEPKYSQSVVTAIELLSITNKRPGDGMSQVKKKQAQYRAGQINRVEIDFLRKGSRVFDFPAISIKGDSPKPYYIVIHWGHRPKEAGVHAIDLRDPLPTIGIPLRPGETEIPIALQPLMDRAYHNGRFPIDYRKPPVPPLDGDDAVWAAELLNHPK